MFGCVHVYIHNPPPLSAPNTHSHTFMQVGWTVAEMKEFHLFGWKARSAWESWAEDSPGRGSSLLLRPLLSRDIAPS